MGLKIDEDYGGSTLLSEWWSKVKNNFATVKEFVEFLGSDIEDERITRIDADADLQEQITQLSKLQFTALESGADVDMLESGGYFVYWHDNTEGKYPFTGTGILIQFDSITKFQIAMYDGGDGTFFMRRYKEDSQEWGMWYENESHTHPNKDVLDNIAKTIETEAQERKAADESLQIEIGTVWDNINLISQEIGDIIQYEDKLTGNSVYEAIYNNACSIDEKSSDLQVEIGTVWDNIDLISQEIGSIIQYEDKLSGSSVYEAIYNNACRIEEINNRVNSKWQLLESDILMEDVDKYAFNLPAKCKGAIVSITLGKNLTMTAGQLYVRDSSGSWAGSRYFNELGATTNEKEIRLIVKPEHGYYYSYAVLRNGSSGSAISRYEVGSEFMTGDATKYNLTTIETKGLIIPEGAIIKIWGLIEE